MLERQDPSEVVLVLGHRVGQLSEDGPSLVGRSPAPVGQRAGRDVDRLGRQHRAATRHLGERLVLTWVAHLHRLVPRDPLASDVAAGLPEPLVLQRVFGHGILVASPSRGERGRLGVRENRWSPSS